jgi:Sulfotransferase family
LHDLLQYFGLLRFHGPEAFTHIGKAGGNTAKKVLYTLHRKLPPTEIKRHYYNLEIHTNGLNDDKAQKNFHRTTTFLYAIRNPLTRVTSAFNYMHYDNTDSRQAQGKSQIKDIFYKRCFPKLEDYFAALNTTAFYGLQGNSFPNDENVLNATVVYEVLGKDPSAKTEYCQRLALVSLQDHLSDLKRINVHLVANNEYFHHCTWQKIPDRELWAARTEVLWDDLQSLDRRLDGFGDFSILDVGRVSNQNKLIKVEQTQKQKDDDKQNWRNLCCALAKENSVYQDILNLAENLSGVQKLGTMTNLWKLCGLSDQDLLRYWKPQKDELMSLSWLDWQKDNCNAAFVRERDDTFGCARGGGTMPESAILK